jgi:Pyruvate/2-oxoacid:ferredoxin oxidoreductase delta subunit
MSALHEQLTNHIEAARVSVTETEDKQTVFKPSQVVRAIELGQKVARRHLWLLRGEASEKRTKKISSASLFRLGPPPPADPEQVISKSAICLERFAKESRRTSRSLRNNTFSKQTALKESARCLSCGRCNLCQQCVLSCPEVCLAVDRKNKRIMLDLEHCKGCGICSYECPRHIITMERPT